MSNVDNEGASSQNVVRSPVIEFLEDAKEGSVIAYNDKNMDMQAAQWIDGYFNAFEKFASMPFPILNDPELEKSLGREFWKPNRKYSVTFLGRWIFLFLVGFMLFARDPEHLSPIDLMMTQWFGYFYGYPTWLFVTFLLFACILATLFYEGRTIKYAKYGPVNAEKKLKKAIKNGETLEFEFYDVIRKRLIYASLGNGNTTSKISMRDIKDNPDE